jgi:hypothetical protein
LETEEQETLLTLHEHHDDEKLKGQIKRMKISGFLNHSENLKSPLKVILENKSQKCLQQLQKLWVKCTHGQWGCFEVTLLF